MIMHNFNEMNRHNILNKLCNLLICIVSRCVKTSEELVNCLRLPINYSGDARF